MAPAISCVFLVALFSASCEAIASTDQMCIEKETNKTYNCENLGLSEIPGTLSNSTECLEFSFNFLPTIQNTTFSRLVNLTFLDLTRCQIYWIHEDTFQSQHQLDTLVLTANPLIFMAETALNGPKSLKHLFFIQTGMSSLDFIPMHNLKNLESLYLGSNHISSIKLPKDFPKEKLKVLDFQNNAIHYLSKEDLGSLQQTTNLSLNLKGNGITGIEPGAFKSTVFQRLDFGGTLDLLVIFKGLQNSTVQSLWLGTFEDVNDEDISSSVFEGLCEMSVESMYLQKHHFFNISSSTFHCFTSLQELDLTATHLKELPSGIVGLKSLKKLVLSANKFTSLCQINAANFPSLTHLYIKGNMKKLDLGTGCLENLENLHLLDLSHDDIEISDCCNMQLKNLSHLQSLNLSYNEPLGLKTEAFQECPQLERLDLAFTQLRVSTEQSPFQNLHLLKVLNLSHCLLDTSNQHVLDGLPVLQHLNLQGNHFPNGNIQKTNPLQTLESLETLILSFCDLSSIDQQAFIRLKIMNHVDLSHNRLTSSSIEALSHLKGIYLNLASNHIDIIPSSLLPILSQQRTISLRGNPLDCTCSNIYFLEWYKENMQKLEDTENTFCANPPLLRGVRLSDVTLSCGITAVGIFFLIVFLLLFTVALIFAVKYFLRWKYQHI
ncbi:CD180 antigen isoform X1 [Mesocricetus auratus]|uniref:CD180 antigen isoform X1 n=2 Tax=Mesocricetus auratus TaxID=10036 RepID=A0ABM2W3Q2_MESAU|nr:CD180 antigen isoform X1 [Mesocricetus auratus]XP_040584958.1 CD180 antigen isoform X1 [Mesocricetus auratus]